MSKKKAALKSLTNTQDLLALQSDRVIVNFLSRLLRVYMLWGKKIAVRTRGKDENR